MRAPVAAAAVVAACLAAATPATADSIAYVKGGDVHVASADGARDVRVTSIGGYSYVSQADDGTMVALAPGERLHRLSRTGEVFADFPTFVSDGAPRSGPVNQFHGPFDPQISPDGRLVAFEWFNDSYESTAPCNLSSVPPCQVLNTHQGVGITRSDGFTGYDAYGLLTGWIAPTWVSNERLLRSGANVTMNEDAVFTTIAPGRGDAGLKRWFWDDSGIGVNEVDMSRNGATIAGIAGFSDELLRIYRPLFDPYTAPAQDLRPFHANTPVVERCLELANPAGGKFESVSVSPDGRHVAYGTADGIHVLEVPDLHGGCAPATRDALVLPGGRFPDFGPAGVPEAPAARGLRLSTAKTPLRRALARGLAVTVRTGARGRVSVVANSGGRRVGAGSAKVGSAGKARVKVRLKRSLRGRRGVRLTLAATFRPASGTIQRARATVRLR